MHVFGTVPWDTVLLFRMEEHDHLISFNHLSIYPFIYEPSEESLYCQNELFTFDVQ